MNLRTYLKKRGLTLDVLDYQQTIAERHTRKRDSENVAEPPNPQAVSKVYSKWLSEQPEIVQEQLPKHWSI